MSVNNKSERKVLHLIDSFGTGGAETWLLECVKYFHDHPELHFQIDFLATGGKKGFYDDQVIALGSKIFYEKYSFKNFFRFRNALSNILKTNNYIAIHNHQDFISGWHFLAGWGSLPGIRISHLHNPYNFVHNYVVNPFRWFSFRAGRLLTVLFTTKITGTSNVVMDEYGYNKWPFKNKRVDPCYCGFEVNKFKYNSTAKQKICRELGWNEKKKIALFVGRIGLHSYDTAANQKNPEFAFSVAKKLVTVHDEWNFLFVGYKGQLGEEMEKDLITNHLDRQIKFLGLRSDINNIMSSSEVLIFPSFWEGLGMVAVEAQASGLAIVMSDTVPAEAIVCKELVHLLNLEKDNKEHWSEIIPVLNSSDNRVTYSIRVSKSPFSIENSVHQLLKTYNYER